jgi:hypothetical protein
MEGEMASSILVCGGRDYRRSDLVLLALDVLHDLEPIALLINGMGGGTDAHARLWARLHAVPVERHPAKWNRFGLAAGPIRNSEMIDRRPTAVVAFPGGRGTAHMVSIAERAGVPVLMSHLEREGITQQWLEAARSGERHGQPG